jgi:hypothetical protein
MYGAGDFKPKIEIDRRLEKVSVRVFSTVRKMTDLRPVDMPELR